MEANSVDSTSPAYVRAVREQSSGLAEARPNNLYFSGIYPLLRRRHHRPGWRKRRRPRPSQRPAGRLPWSRMAPKHHRHDDAADIEAVGDEAEHLAERTGRGDVAHQHVARRHDDPGRRIRMTAITAISG